jgi:hypothetical protein
VLHKRGHLRRIYIEHVGIAIHHTVCRVQTVIFTTANEPPYIESSKSAADRARIQ